MMTVSISGRHSQSNQYCLSILDAFGLSPCPAVSCRMRLFVPRFLLLLLQQANPVFFLGLIVFMEPVPASCTG